MKKIYLIQGIIFQNGHVFGTAYKPGLGIASTIHDALIFSMCQGIVGPNPENEEVLFGTMQDKWGKSEITNFKISEGELTFIKQYKGRPIINYRFKKNGGNVWHGQYEGVDCGKGESKCILTEIDESFLNPGN